MRRLCAGLYHDAVHTSLVCCIWPGRICFWYTRRDDHRPALGRDPVIRRSILYALLCFPIRLAGSACCPGPWCFWLSGNGVQAGLQVDMPLYLGHEVADLLHHTLVM